MKNQNRNVSAQNQERMTLKDYADQRGLPYDYKVKKIFRQIQKSIAGHYEEVRLGSRGVIIYIDDYAIEKLDSYDPHQGYISSVPELAAQLKETQQNIRNWISILGLTKPHVVKRGVLYLDEEAVKLITKKALQSQADRETRKNNILLLTEKISTLATELECQNARITRLEHLIEQIRKE